MTGHKKVLILSLAVGIYLIVFAIVWRLRVPSEHVDLASSDSPFASCVIARLNEDTDPATLSQRLYKDYFRINGIDAWALFSTRSGKAPVTERATPVFPLTLECIGGPFLGPKMIELLRASGEYDATGVLNRKLLRAWRELKPPERTKYCYSIFSIVSRSKSKEMAEAIYSETRGDYLSVAWLVMGHFDRDDVPIDHDEIRKISHPTLALLVAKCLVRWRKPEDKACILHLLKVASSFALYAPVLEAVRKEMESDLDTGEKPPDTETANTWPDIVPNDEPASPEE